MKVQVTQANLNRALSAVSRVASQRSTLPILSNILLHTEEKTLYLTATNLELAIRVRVGGKVDKPGRLAVPARLLNDFVSTLPDEKLSLEQTKKHSLHVKAEHYDSVINGSDPEEFPSIPDTASGENMKIDASKFKDALQQTIFAASGDEARQTLTGVYIHSADGSIYLVATDSYRLAERKLASSKKELAHNVPASTMQEVLRNVDAAVDNDQKVDVTLSESQAVFTIGETVIISRLIDGKYPDYRQIIPSKNEVEAELDRDDFINVVRVAGLFARESAGSVTIKVSEAEQQLSVEAVASQVGENTSSLEGKIKGDGQVSLNSRYLVEVLQVLKDDTVKFKLSGKHSPCVITPSNSKDYIHLVMPLKA